MDAPLKKRSPRRPRRLPKAEEIQDRDTATFTLLAPAKQNPDLNGCRYSTREFLYALLGPRSGGYYGYRNRFTIYLQQGYLKAAPQQYSTSREKTGEFINKDTIVELASRGATIIGARCGQRVKATAFNHTVFTDIALQYFRLAFRDTPGFAWRPFADVLAHPNCPERTRKHRRPEAVILGKKRNKKGEIIDDLVIPDIPLMAVEHERPGGVHRAFFFTEIDGGSERVESRVGSTDSLFHKAQRYDQIFERGLVCDRYGVHSKAYVLFIFTSERRMQHFLYAIRYLKHADRFICTAVDGFDSRKRMPHPHSDFLTMDWYTPKGTFKFTDI
jgi:hypothetical protein